MKTVVPIRNKQAVKDFIHFTNQVYVEAGVDFVSIAANSNGLMKFMEQIGYEGDIDELIKDMITHNRRTPLFEKAGEIRNVGYCCTPAFEAIYKLENKVILVPIPAPEPIMIDKLKL